MKTANAALVLAAGILLLAVVVTNRTGNLSAAWTALLGTAPATGKSPSTIASSAVPAWASSPNLQAYGSALSGTYQIPSATSLPSTSLSSLGVPAL
jgi:hypothetical protein